MVDDLIIFLVGRPVFRDYVSFKEGISLQNRQSRHEADTAVPRPFDFQVSIDFHMVCIAETSKTPGSTIAGTWHDENIHVACVPRPLDSSTLCHFLQNEHFNHIQIPNISVSVHLHGENIMFGLPNFN